MQNDRNTAQKTAQIEDIAFEEVGKAQSPIAIKTATKQPAIQVKNKIVLVFRGAVAHVPDIDFLDVLELLMVLVSGLIKLILLAIYGVLWLLAAMVTFLYTSSKNRLQKTEEIREAEALENNGNGDVNIFINIQK